MSEIGAYEAKTHLPKLLERVAKGERFVITRHGHPVAELTPVQGNDREAASKAVDALLGFRETLRKKGVRITQDEIKGWIVEGRRY